MRSILLVLMIIFSGYAVQAFHHTALKDSIGTTKRGGKTYIIHRIEQGETLFALSRRYNVHVDQISAVNPEANKGLKIGQEIYIPVAAIREPAQVPEGAQTHEVKPSETLFSISKMYNVSLEDLRKWNGLSTNEIKIGDKLVVKPGHLNAEKNNATEATRPQIEGKTHTVAAGETLFSISKVYNVRTQDIKRWNKLSSNNISIGQVLVVGPDDAPQMEESSSMLPNTGKSNDNAWNGDEKDKDTSPEVDVQVSTEPVVHNTSSDTETDAASTYDYKKVIENGFAEVINDSGDTKKYLALHRNAPVGTIMQVKNEMNNQTVFVRVVGKIPGTDNNDKVLIKISKKAYDRLGAVDAKFPVEISYIP